MRSFNKIIIFIIVLFIAKLIADQVVLNNYILVLIAFAAFLYMIYSSWNQKFTLLSLTVLIPFAFPPGFPFPIDKWIEILAPVFAFFLCFEILLNRQTPFPRKSALFLTAVAVLALWAIVNYIRNPVLGTMAFGSDSKETGIRTYFIIIICIATFLCSLWFFTYKELNASKWLWTIIITCLIIGDLRIIGYYQNYQIPFLSSTFKFGNYKQFLNEQFFKGASEAKIGIGGLREMAALGVPLILSILYKRKLNIYFVLILINIIIFIFLGGGRSNFIGIVLAISLFVSLFKRKYLWPIILLLLLLVPAYFLSDVYLSESQYGRAFLFKGGFKEQASDRYYTYIYMWEVFKDNPIFGKGIGYMKVNMRDVFPGRVNTANEFFLTKLIEGRLSGTGGHGAYISIMTIFGIGGIFFLVVMLFGGIYYAYKIIRERSDFSDDAQLALFAFLYLLILAVTFIAGGNGFNEIELWFFAGMIAGLKAKESIKDKGCQLPVDR
ncbi:MAG: hypothetical protein C4526_01995 [Nitrospiraceae bacterium]|nr:MAG: hypothetical protein C4526_01995 [Nitrospiraceae bacterium]